MSVAFAPVNATAVRIIWDSSYYLPTILRYTSYFTATGSVMSQQERVLPPAVTSTVVSLNDKVDGYEHNFTLRYDICDIVESPVTTATFSFGK